MWAALYEWITSLLAEEGAAAAATEGGAASGLIGGAATGSAASGSAAAAGGSAAGVAGGAAPGMAGATYESVVPPLADFSMAGADGATGESVFNSATQSAPANAAPEKGFLQRMGDGASGDYGDLAKNMQDGNYAGVSGKMMSMGQPMQPGHQPAAPQSQISPLVQVYMKYGSRGPYGSYGGY